MAVRSHPVVPAAILSGLAVRSIEIAALANLGRYGDLNRPLIRALADGLERDLGRARRYGSTGRIISRALGQAAERARTMDRICAQGLAARLGIATTDGLAQALTDGALDDFTSADLTCANLAQADLTGVRWSLTGTAWPPGTDIEALLARSEIHPGDVLVLRHRGTMWQPTW
jgi:Pentapeptide repeats (8 copies)